MILHYFKLFFIVLLISSFKSSTIKTWKYLSLGDSYTICTGTNEQESWPNLLTKHLIETKIKCTLLENPARNGFTTKNLMDKELPLLKKLKPNFVTLLIGVNDWVRGISKQEFKTNLIFILDEIQKEIPDRTKLILITIPDFGVTPQGKGFGTPEEIAKGILDFNNIIEAEASKRNLSLVDIFELTQGMAFDKDLVSQDDLHPSAKEYALWEKLIFIEAIKLLK